MIKAKEENVITEKGVRAFIMEKMLNYPFTRGAVINLDKKTVQVQLEGDEKTIKTFVKDIEKSLPEQFGNPTIQLKEFCEDASLQIPQLIRSSQALMVGQLQKGIGVQLEILETLKHLQSNMSESIGLSRSLPQEIAKALKEK